jgi:hypothetical protein
MQRRQYLEDYRTFHYLGNQMNVKRQQAEVA